ncbi:MAG: hypothetical protein KDC90_19060 [Ignavibacteriae bacterium]|nr:hypothetical protein [Ignavibacteriota bacterium]
MIEFKLSKDGNRIFLWNGRQLCSSYAPIDEAKNWVQKSLPKLFPEKTLIILGLGNGYHVAEVLSQFPEKKIIVINDLPEIVTVASEIIGLRSGLVNIISATRVEELVSSSEFTKIFKNSFRVVRFFPATALHIDFFSAMKDLLRGRTYSSLMFHLSMREKNIRSLFHEDVYEQKTEKGLQLLDFKKITKSSFENNDLNTNFHVVQILRELMK